MSYGDDFGEIGWLLASGDTKGVVVPAHMLQRPSKQGVQEERSQV